MEENREFIIGAFRELLEAEDTSSKIRVEIESFLDNSLGKMVTMFIGIDTITEKVLNGINKYLYSKKGEDNIIELTNSIIGKAMDLDFKSLSILVEPINTKEVEEDANDYLIKKIDILINSHPFKEILMDNIERSIENILDMETSQIIGYIDLENLEDNVRDLYEVSSSSIETLILELVNLFDVSKIVEDEINSFEIEYTEKLILDIADRELRAITRLGALLGALLGLLSPILQNI